MVDSDDWVKESAYRQILDILREQAGGEQLHAFAMGDHPELLAGTQLTGVKLSMRQQDTVVYYILEDYRIVVPPGSGGVKEDAMKKIERFQITGMTISGFKCYQASTILDFGPQTAITGGNGLGKTSIADAIAFAITGLPFFGERGIDKLHNEVQPEVSVSLRFLDETGAPHELTRTRHKPHVHPLRQLRDPPA